MAEWVRLCAVKDSPKAGEVAEFNAGARQVCLANIEGRFHALDNLCPHRDGPLGQGWIEGNTVVCPWHAWAFDVTTGAATEPDQAQVKVYPVRTAQEEILVDLS